MDVFAWIAANETVLSGLAAIVAVAGMVLTPLGIAMRRRWDARADPVPPAPAPAPPAAPVAPASDRPSIAVLPFLNLSEDREQEFLADGMTEDLITGLAANRHLSVVSRNSTFAYKGRSPDVRAVGRELGVRYVLEGSVRRVGESMRTTAQLIDSGSGDHLWAAKYDRPYAEMFAVQDEVVASIAGALNAQLTTAEYARARRGKPSELGAWERVQRALLGIFHQPSADEMRNAIVQLREAVALDPDYAYARSALAWQLYSAIINGVSDDIPGAGAEAERHLKAALERGNEDPLTLFYAGCAYVYSGRWDRSIQILESSLARNPHQPDALNHLGLAFAYLGRFAEAHRHFDRAEQLATSGGMTLIYSWYRAQALAIEGRHADAVTLLDAFLPKAPRYPTARIILGLCLDALDRHAEARAAIERVVRENPGLNIEGLALLVSAHPDPEQGRARAARLREYWPHLTGSS
jgi:TolB-like protein/Flp pilus assembly protein TadD